MERIRIIFNRWKFIEVPYIIVDLIIEPNQVDACLVESDSTDNFNLPQATPVELPKPVQSFIPNVIALSIIVLDGYTNNDYDVYVPEPEQPSTCRCGEVHAKNA
jgi:hypothetical protein